MIGQAGEHVGKLCLRVGLVEVANQCIDGSRAAAAPEDFTEMAERKPSAWLSISSTLKGQNGSAALSCPPLRVLHWG
jgi:hypothetical protein